MGHNPRDPLTRTKRSLVVCQLGPLIGMNKMRKIILLVFGFLMVAQASAKKSDLTPDQALGQLMEGNKRYVTARSKHAHEGADRRHELEKTQHPFACILSCSDSRVA